MEKKPNLIPIYNDYKEVKNYPNIGNNTKLDTEILRIENELQEINKMYHPSPIKFNSTQLKGSQEIPVFHVSLYSPETKGKVGSPILEEILSKDYTKETPKERCEKFNNAKIANFRKSINKGINAEKRLDRNKFWIRQTDPLLFIQITLTPDITIKLPVTKMDTPSFLAEECFSMAGFRVSRQLINELADVIEVRINEEIERIIKNRKQRAMQERIYQNQCLKDSSKNRVKEFNLWTNQRSYQRENKNRILGKLSVIIGKSRTGEIVIREGDDPLVLVNNFIKTFSLSKDHTQHFLEAIKNLIENSSKNIVGEDISFSPSKFRTPESGKENNDDVLFKVQFNMEEGRKVFIDIKKDSNLYQVAYQFVVDNGLEIEKVESVWEYLKELYKVILQFDQ